MTKSILMLPITATINQPKFSLCVSVIRMNHRPTLLHNMRIVLTTVRTQKHKQTKITEIHKYKKCTIFAECALSTQFSYSIVSSLHTIKSNATSNTLHIPNCPLAIGTFQPMFCSLQILFTWYLVQLEHGVQHRPSRAGHSSWRALMNLPAPPPSQHHRHRRR